MAGDDHGDGVGADGRADRACGGRPPDFGGDVLVGCGFSVGNIEERFPDRSLKFRAVEGECDGFAKFDMALFQRCAGVAFFEGFGGFIEAEPADPLPCLADQDFAVGGVCEAIGNFLRRGGGFLDGLDLDVFYLHCHLAYRLAM